MILSNVQRNSNNLIQAGIKGRINTSITSKQNDLHALVDGCNGLRSLLLKDEYKYFCISAHLQLLFLLNEH